MSYRGQQNSPYLQTSGYGYQNNQRNFNTVSPQNQLLGGWGTPARGYSPSPHRGISPRGDKNFHSPASSPRHLTFNSPYHTPNISQQFRLTSPGERRFKTPISPFSPPGSRGRGSGRKQNFNRSFNQTPRQDRNCNPGGSSNIEDYFHPSMIDDPWKFCSPVPVTQTPSITT